jgi:hypothetical protein
MVAVATALWIARKMLLHTDSSSDMLIVGCVDSAESTAQW